MWFYFLQDQMKLNLVPNYEHGTGYDPSIVAEQETPDGAKES